MNFILRDQDLKGSFRSIFWVQRLQTTELKIIVKFSGFQLLLSGAFIVSSSPQVCHALWSTGVLTLPSGNKKSLIKSDVGFQSAVNSQLINEIDVREDEEMYVVLSFGVMKTRVLNIHSCSLLGFTILGDILCNTLDDFEQLCKSAVSKYYRHGF